MIQMNANIMGQAYTLACKDGEQEALQQAVAYLDARMSAIRDAGKIKGNDRIAVMAALSIAAEMLTVRSTDGPFQDMSIAEIHQKITALHVVLDQALAPQENLF